MANVTQSEWYADNKLGRTFEMLRPIRVFTMSACAILYIIQMAVAEEEIVLAQVGSELVTEREFETFVAGLPEWTKSKEKGTDRIRDYLQSLIDRALILQKAQDEGLGQEIRVKENMQVALRARFGQELEQRYVLPRVQISADEMRREFVERNWGRKLKIAHILTHSEDRAREAMAELQSGQSFESVAYRFSDNRTTAEHGGEKPHFYSRINATLAVREPLFNLGKGQISKIIPISKGYEIFKVLDEKTVPYTEVQHEIFEEMKRSRLQNVRRTYVDSLAEKFQWRLVPSGMALFKRILRDGYQADEKKIFHLSEVDSEKTLFLYDGGQITLADVVNRSQFIRQGQYVKDSLKVNYYLERDIKIPQLMLLQAYSLKIDQESSIKNWVEQKEEELLIREMRRLVTSKINVTEQNARSYYENNPRSYQTSAMVEVIEVQVESEVRAVELLEQIRSDVLQAKPLADLLTKMAQKVHAGQSVKDEIESMKSLEGNLSVYDWLNQRTSNPLELARFIDEIKETSEIHELVEDYIVCQLAVTHSVRHGSKETEGFYKIYWHEEPRFGPLVKMSMESQVGELIGPVKYKGLYSVAKIINRKEASRRPFEEVKKGIRYTLLREKENEQFERWLNELRLASESKITLFNENIESLGHRLQAKKL